ALRTFSGLRGWVVACAFSPDSKTLAAAGEDDKVMVWETDTGAWLRTFPCPQTRTRCLGFTPDGSTLVAGGEDGKLRMWDLSQRDQPAAETFDLHQGPILSLAFAPDRQMLATGGEDECIRMLNYGLKSPLSALRLHHGAVSTLAFSSDSRWLASGSKDGVRIWDTQSMSLLAWLPCHDRVLAVGFVQSNSGLLVAADGGASHHPEFLRLELANFIPAAKPLDYDI
ncbi:hypothetical protein EG829_32830, partial [bacterium]|nr:hypothetical protein [bacterium]